jgi:membrane protein
LRITRTFADVASVVAGAAFVYAASALDRARRGATVIDQQRPRPAQWGDSRAASASGAGADTPSEVPAQGWKEIAQRVFTRIGRDRILLVAAGVTFYALLALFPAIAALVSIFGLVADPALIERQMQNMAGIVPGGAVEIIGGQVQRIASQGGGTLGVSFVTGLVISLWSANAGMKSMFDALNIVYQEEEKRSFLKLNARSLALTLGAMLFLIVAAGAIIVLPAIFSLIGLGETSVGTLLALARWPLLLLILMVFLAVLYRYGPSRDKPRWRWVTWGSGLAAFAWLAGSALFSWYVANFGNYNETYGSLGAAIGFLTWIWLSAIVILVGGELNAELEHQTERDTTEGPSRPLGTRGAEMADRVAPEA